MQLGTIELNKENNKLDTEDETFFRQTLIHARQFKIELIEISNVKSPTSITLKMFSDQGRFRVPFYRHIKDFIHFNDSFILDTSTIPQFTLNPKEGFLVEVQSDEDFILKIFYSTDRNSDFTSDERIL